MRDAPSPFKTPEFRALRRQWDQKLKDSGFRDIECRDRKTGEENGLLLGMAPGDLQRTLYDPSVQRYYELARAHVHRVERRVRALRHSVRRAFPPSGKALEALQRAEQELSAWSVHAEGLPAAACAKHSGLTKDQVVTYLAKERTRMFAAEARLAREESNGTEVDCD